ncbi:unnamed protein product [Owenia fusiformis]|uniref:Uncharacterized protein n=1 Tax=Owenia fusiformis TaxID=6347 RepID=A0A8J1TCC3_OWEFU|nr:unnamed protein product [Owenia fusiformis]
MKCTRNLVLALALGQLIAVFLAGTAVTSGLLTDRGVAIPTAQSFLNYVLLCVVYTSILACRSGESSLLGILKERWWKYMLIGFVDVEANYLIVKAYHYTTVTSVQLLDCFTIPTVLALSWLFLKVRYRWTHIGGVIFCLAGIGTLVLADVLSKNNAGSGTAENQLLGDALVISGALLYGVSNVAEEAVVRNFDRVEFLGMLGMFGSIINGVQFVLFERREVSDVDFNLNTVLLLLGFAVCLFAVYSIFPIAIQLSSAAAVNLSLLSADFYAVLLGLFLFKYKFHILYFFSIALIIVGIILYNLKPPESQIEQIYDKIPESGDLQSSNGTETPTREPEVETPKLGTCFDIEPVVIENKRTDARTPSCRTS